MEAMNMSCSSPLLETKPSPASILMSFSSPTKSLSTSIASDLWRHQCRLEQSCDPQCQLH
ncbi:hypothetical protein Peur_056062 [Populus x canadensis]